MSNSVFIQEGKLLDYTAPEDKKAGDIVFLGAMACQVVTDVDSGKGGALRSEGIIRVVKETITDEYDDGDAVKWNATNKTADPSGTDGTLGKCVNGGSAATDPYVFVKLNA